MVEIDRTGDGIVRIRVAMLLQQGGAGRTGQEPSSCSATCAEVGNFGKLSGAPPFTKPSPHTKPECGLQAIRLSKSMVASAGHLAYLSFEDHFGMHTC